MSPDIHFCLLCTKAREWAIASFFGILLTLCLWGLFFDTNNARVTESEIRDASGRKAEIFHAGDVMEVYRKVCVDKMSPGIVVSEIVNLDTGVLFPMGSRPTGAFTGCSSRTVAVRIPTEAPPGRYEWRVVAHYDVNPLRTIVVPLPPTFFEIRARAQAGNAR